ncbi:MAG: glycosyltransferase [Planctomycetaceae bacterium]|nr:glycosyltransferase [Planctomycetaceae bacterium]
MPECSVVLPVYNAAETLHECLESIRAQTLSDWELVVVNDGSDDGSEEILTEVSVRNDRIKVVSPGRITLVPAINLGYQTATADLIARMDADDIMHPERLEKQVEFLRQHQEIDVLATQVSLFPKEILQEGYREYVRWQNNCLTPEEIADNIFVESPLANPSVMYRRKVYETFGPYRDGLFPEDYEFWLRLHAAGINMAKLPEVLLEWRESNDRATRTDPRFSRASFDSIRADYLARDPRLHSGRAVVVWGAGRKTRQRVKLIEDRGVTISAYIDIDPNKIGGWIGTAEVHGVEWLDRSPQPFVLNYVTNHGARELISSELEQRGYQRGEDYLSVG